MPEPIQITHPEVVTCLWATDNGFCLCTTCKQYSYNCPPCSKDDWRGCDCEITQCNKYSKFKIKIKIKIKMET